jgi:hypothetical protein
MLSAKTKLVIIAVFVALLSIAGFVAAKLEAIQPGGSCENSSQRDSCSGPGAACISADKGDDYCSIECKASGECPGGMKCEEIESGTYSAKDGAKVKSEKVKMCVRP